MKSQRKLDHEDGRGKVKSGGKKIGIHTKNSEQAYEDAATSSKSQSCSAGILSQVEQDLKMQSTSNTSALAPPKDTSTTKQTSSTYNDHLTLIQQHMQTQQQQQYNIITGANNAVFALVPAGSSGNIGISTNSANNTSTASGNIKNADTGTKGQKDTTGSTTTRRRTGSGNFNNSSTGNGNATGDNNTNHDPSQPQQQVSSMTVGIPQHAGVVDLDHD